MLHSSKGIQFLELKQYAMPLNPNCPLSNTQQLPYHRMPLQAAAADSAAVLCQPGTVPVDGFTITAVIILLIASDVCNVATCGDRL